MSEFVKVECNCIDAYTQRGMRDPNCCACSCEHNDMVEEIQRLQAEVERLTRMRLYEAKRAEAAERRIEELERECDDLKAHVNYLMNDCHRFCDKRLDEHNTEQQIKALEEVLTGLKAHHLISDRACRYIELKIEQLRKGGE